MKPLYRIINAIITFSLIALVTACGSDSSQGLGELSVDAGDDRVVYLGSSVNLSASIIKGNQTIRSVEWSQTSGLPLATISDGETDNAVFTVPNVASDTTLTFSVTVTDEAGQTATDSVNIAITALYRGQFVYGPTKGLGYATETQEGITDVNGYFYYQEGETITFMVGDLQLGDTVPAIAELAVHQLINGYTLFTNSADFQRWLDYNNHASRVPFNRFANTVAFLQTMDNDANPTNGISIESGMGDLFDGIKVRFDQRPQDFDNGEFYPSSGGNNPELRYVAHKAKLQGLLSTAEIKKPLVALNHYYTSLNLDYTIAIPGELDDIHYDGSGAVSNTYRYSTKIDAGGNVSEYFDGSDRIYYEYNENGRLIKEQSDYDADDSIDRVLTYFYDSNGNTTKVEYDNDNNGVADSVRTTTYDDYGNRVTDIWDSNNDGTPESRSEFTYNDSFYLLTSKTYTNNSTTPSSTYEYTYTTEGRRETEIYNTTWGNGKSTYTYDSNGNLIQEETDKNLDDSVDQKALRSFDANGNLLELKSYKRVSGSLALQRVFTYTYEQGTHLQLSQEVDVDGDLVYDEKDTFTYNADGTLATDAWDDYSTTASPDNSSAYTYNDSGYITRYVADHDGDGVADSVYTYEYDDNGFIVRVDNDYQNDDQVDRRTVSTPVSAGWQALWWWDETF